jgi:fucose permease
MAGSQAVMLTMAGGAVMVGLILPLLGSLEAALARRLGRGEGRVPGLRLAFTLGLLPGLLLGGLAVDRWGPQEGLILGCLAAALGVASLALSRGLGTMLASAVVLGAALGPTHTATAVLMPAAFEPPVRLATAVSLGYLIVGACMVLMKGLVPWLERRAGLRQSLLLLGLLCLVPGAMAGLTPPDDFPAAVATGEPTALWRDPRLLLAGLVLFLYYPLERALSVWGPAYLAEIGHGERRLPLLFAGFWAAFLGARFLTALAPPWLVPWLILLPSVLGAVTIGNLVGLYRPVGGVIGFWLLGACMGPVFPALVSVVFAIYPDRMALALADVLALGSLSGLVLQPGLEGVARRRPLRVTMRLVMLTTLVVAAPAVVLCLVK